MAILAPKIWNDNFKRRERNMSNTELNKLRGRVINKHNTENEWLKSVYIDGDKSKGLVTNPFIPIAGELIIYDPDSDFNYYRFKIGNGVDNVVNLQFTRDMELVRAIDELSPPLYIPYGAEDRGAEITEALLAKRPIYVSIPQGNGIPFNIDVPLVAAAPFEREGYYMLIFSTMGHTGNIGTSEE
jgi:hypothetical protein